MTLPALDLRRPRCHGQSRLPPGPWQPSIYQTLGWWYRPLPLMESCRNRFGDRFTLRLIGVPPVVVLSSPQDVKAVLTANPDVLLPGRGAEVLEPVVGRRSIALMDGAEHLAERRLLLPALHGERLHQMAETMRTVATSGIEDWPSEDRLELHPRLQRLSLDIVMHTVLGLTHDDRRTVPLRNAITETLECSARLPNLVPRTRRTIAGRGPWARLLAARDRTDRLLLNLIEHRRRTTEDRGDVLASLLAARYDDGSAMPDRQIRDELMTLVAGGHESIALAVSWAFTSLARTPAALRRLVAEVDAGTTDEYLTATVHEALRHRPVLPMFPRRVARETTIGSWRYPAGILVQPDAYLLHHNPVLYPDPYAFRPDRFIEQPPGTYTWVPFGGGRRRCLGSAFATLEMATIIRVLLATRDVRPVTRGERTARHNIALAPARGGLVRLPRRRLVLQDGPGRRAVSRS